MASSVHSVRSSYSSAFGSEPEHTSVMASLNAQLQTELASVRSGGGMVTPPQHFSALRAWKQRRLTPRNTPAMTPRSWASSQGSPRVTSQALTAHESQTAKCMVPLPHCVTWWTLHPDVPSPSHVLSMVCGTPDDRAIGSPALHDKSGHADGGARALHPKSFGGKTLT